MELPPTALEVTPSGLVIPVEAPPCGQSLDIPESNVHLKCDRPRDHLEPSHRQIIQLSPPHSVGWCDDYCATPCEPLKGVLRTLREQGLTVHQQDHQ